MAPSIGPSRSSGAQSRGAQFLAQLLADALAQLGQGEAGFLLDSPAQALVVAFEHRAPVAAPPLAATEPFCSWRFQDRSTLRLLTPKRRATSAALSPRKRAATMRSRKSMR